MLQGSVPALASHPGSKTVVFLQCGNIAFALCMIICDLPLPISNTSSGISILPLATSVIILGLRVSLRDFQSGIIEPILPTIFSSLCNGQVESCLPAKERPLGQARL